MMLLLLLLLLRVIMMEGPARLLAAAYDLNCLQFPN